MVITENKSIEISKNISNINVTGNNKVTYKVFEDYDYFSLENDEIYQYCKDKRCLIVISKSIYPIYGNMINTYFEKYLNKDMYQCLVLEDVDGTMSIKSTN